MAISGFLEPSDTEGSLPPGFLPVQANSSTSQYSKADTKGRAPIVVFMLVTSVIGEIVCTIVEVVAGDGR